MVAPKPVGQFVDGHPVHARFSFIAASPPVRTNQILRVASLLHQVSRQGSLRLPCRERLLRSMRRGSGSARSAVAVVAGAFLLLRVHRMGPAAPCIKDSARRPVELLWPLLTSPTPSHRVAPAVVRVCTDRIGDLSR